MESLTVVFDKLLPSAQWGPLFQVLRMEQPKLRLDWLPAQFPSRERSLLEGGDVGVRLEPPSEESLDALTIGLSRMVVVMAVGHRLARRRELRVADILDEVFPGGVDVHPGWRAFWTLDAYRGGPPRQYGDDAHDAAEGLESVVAGHAIATFPASLAGGLPHPGIVSIPLVDGPPVATKLVWRSGDGNPLVRQLIEIAESMAGELQKIA